MLGGPVNDFEHHDFCLGLLTPGGELFYFLWQVSVGGIFHSGLVWLCGRFTLLRWNALCHFRFCVSHCEVFLPMMSLLSARSWTPRVQLHFLAGRLGWAMSLIGLSIFWLHPWVGLACIQAGILVMPAISTLACCGCTGLHHFSSPGPFWVGLYTLFIIL